MDLYIMDGLNGLTGILSAYESLLWNRQFTGLGYFQIIAAATAENIDLLREGRYLVRASDVTQAGYYRDVMVIKRVAKRFDAEKGYMLDVSGTSLKGLLSQRIIWEQITAEGQQAGAVIWRAIQENAINPQIAARTIANINGSGPQFTTPTVSVQVFGENLGEFVAEMCTTYGIGWELFIYGGAYVINFLQGADRSTGQSTNPPVIFSPDMDNLINAETVTDLDTYRNAALIGGEGDGLDQKLAWLGSSTGLDRFETYIDAADLSSNDGEISEEEYIYMLQSHADRELKNGFPLRTFEAEINTDGVYQIGRDYDLGDFVTVDDGKGTTAKTQLTEVLYSEDESGITTTGTFTEMEE